MIARLLSCGLLVEGFLIDAISAEKRAVVTGYGHGVIDLW